MSAMELQQTDESNVHHSKRVFKRTFIYLERPLTKAPSGKKMESLKASGRCVDISFTRNHSDAAMGRLLLASFPSLLGISLKSLTFIKSYDRGHSMATVKKGLMSGEEIVTYYSSANKKKIYFHSQQPATSTATSTSTQATAMVDLTHDKTPPQNGAATRRLLTAMAQRAGVSHEDHDIDLNAPKGPNEEQTSDVELDCIIHKGTSVPSSSAGNSHAKGHVKVLTVEPEVVGDVAEDLSTFGFPEKERNKEGWGRTEEVALILKKLTRVTKGNMLPFMTHTLNEILWQARQDAAVCLLLLFSENNSDNFIDVLLKVLNNQLKGLTQKVLIWVADSQSNEGSKVQAKYGVGDQTTLLVVVASQIPQCVNIFNETNIDETELKDALASAQQMVLNLESKRMKLPRAKLGEEKSNQGPQGRVSAKTTSVSAKTTETEGKSDVKSHQEPQGSVSTETETAGKSDVKLNQEPQGSVSAETVGRSDVKEEDTTSRNNHNNSDDDEKETEVTFGPATTSSNDDLEKTVEDEVDAGLAKKGKRKKKKNKKNKKNKKKSKPEDQKDVVEPAEKKPRVEQLTV